jgi:TRAP-type mannitol/chloroaromatic compound transport system substrate-binding protein
MQRRYFLATAGSISAAAGLSTPAIAQGMPTVNWRMASSFPKNLDTIYGAGERIAKRVDEATGGKFKIRVFAAGEIVPGLQVLDAVQGGTVECGYTAGGYYAGKDTAFAFDSGIPFGLTERQQTAWMMFGGGEAAMRDLYKDYNIINLMAGNTGAQMGGWFRKEMKSPEDLKGLKFRIGGFGGPLMAKLGVVPQMIAAGDVYLSLEKGTIDGAEFIGPYDDEKLGLYKIAKYYHYPAWWEGCAQLSLLCNLEAYNKLPKVYQSIVQAACYDAHTWMMAKYDAQNPAAMRRLVASGAVLRPFPRSVMDAAYKASNEINAELSAKNPRFKKIYDSWVRFRDEQVLWWRVAEYSFESYMIAANRS